MAELRRPLPPFGRQRRIARHAERVVMDVAQPRHGAGAALRCRLLGPQARRRHSPARSRRPKASSRTACPGRRHRPARPPFRTSAPPLPGPARRPSLRSSRARDCAGRRHRPARRRGAASRRPSHDRARRRGPRGRPHPCCSAPAHPRGGRAAPTDRGRRHGRRHSRRQAPGRGGARRRTSYPATTRSLSSWLANAASSSSVRRSK